MQVAHHDIPLFLGSPDTSRVVDTRSENLVPTGRRAATATPTGPSPNGIIGRFDYISGLSYIETKPSQTRFMEHSQKRVLFTWFQAKQSLAPYFGTRWYEVTLVNRSKDRSVSTRNCYSRFQHNRLLGFDALIDFPMISPMT